MLKDTMASRAFYRNVQYNSLFYSFKILPVGQGQRWLDELLKDALWLRLWLRLSLIII